jgi:cardiolipin synthase C
MKAVEITTNTRAAGLLSQPLLRTTVLAPQRERSQRPGSFRRIIFSLLTAALGAGCSSLPPGSHYPKSTSNTLTDPQATRFGRLFDQQSNRNGGLSGFRILNVGVDGFLIRLEMINAAERTLDLEYYTFRGDETGRLLTDALLQAAERGVRVRVLVDDAETVAGDEQLLTLSGQAGIEIRVFNPWKYRGHSALWRDFEFLMRRSRLDYRMHNKMLIADGALGLAGGRNIGDQYFQIDPHSQFADDDVVAAGPIIADLSSCFDRFWNSELAIPAEALTHRDPKDLPASSARLFATARARKVAAAGLEYEKKLATGEPLRGLTSGATPLNWSVARFVSDAPDKKAALANIRVGDLMYVPVAERASHAQTEVLVVTPYFVPTNDELDLLRSRSQQRTRVRVLTNSLDTNQNIAAHAGYTHYRVPLLRSGVQLNEVRASLGNARGSGESRRIARFGNYALHAKLYVFDRRSLFIGSMNLDARSKHLNTEMGLIIDSNELAQQEATRFEAMTRPDDSYSLALQLSAGEPTSKLSWHTVEGGHCVDYYHQPVSSFWRKWAARVLAWLPLDREL